MLTETDKLQICSFYVNGQTMLQIAKQFHVHETTILYYLKKAGIDRRSSKNRLSEPETYLSLANQYPELLDEWDSCNEVSPYNIKPYSNFKAFWRCKKDHKWIARIANRTKLHQGCPYCSGRNASLESNLAVDFPTLAKEWHPTKNGDLNPYQIKAGSHLRVFWLCLADINHEWQAAIYNRTISKSGCPFCSGRQPWFKNNLEILSPELIAEWSPQNIKDPKDYTNKSHYKAWWVCKKGHEWLASIYNRVVGKTGCPRCSINYTGLEQFVENKLNIKKLDQRILEHTNYRPDFQLTDNIYLNADGIYWHCELYRDKNYHFKLREAFAHENKRLIQIYSDEIYNKWSIVDSIIKNAVKSIFIKLNARDCNILPINSYAANEFLSMNHLMGTIHGTLNFGLFYKNEIAAVICVRRKDDKLEISRFCNKLYCSIRGSFSKLLSYCIDLYKPKYITSFCDLRYSTGDSYINNGFKLANIGLGWCWTDKYTRFNRLSCTAGVDKSEMDNARERGWFKIYDAGQAKYILKL
jgi:hypothetical protein